MKTHCNGYRFDFQASNNRQVIGDFGGGSISSDGGGVFLREIDNRYQIIDQLSDCFVDNRNPKLIEHTVKELLSQRIFGIALGYEDLIDHDELRGDPLLATLVGKSDPTGESRELARDKGKPLAGKSTLNRLELPVNKFSDKRYKKIDADFDKIADLFLKLFIDMQTDVPETLILDLDATDDPLHGNQEGRFFHGYYHHYCYMPLYIFCDQFLLSACLRPSNCDGSTGTIDELQRIVSRLRGVWPKVKLTIRADSGFCREEIMNWCEANDVDYVLGLAKNDRLLREIVAPLKEAQQRYNQTKMPARVFTEFNYKTLKTWKCERRVIGKAEFLSKGRNPRFIVTSFSQDKYTGQVLYEQIYCARGEMENRIKEQQLCLFADRTSTSLMMSNQLRLWFSSIAYVLINAFRKCALAGTTMAHAQCSTIRLKLLKIGALIRISVRRIWISMSSGYPYKEIFEHAFKSLKPLKT